ncbi:hypothetical protein DE146DRAFT_626107 [Phaeosphaeria sp. MPI-PUGE-AT-0046c]|nr:hypothetical protein DE146DRAFT_626107 [Phaeosphaeria sp. MPI-PUGE-AT-0046c]
MSGSPSTPTEPVHRPNLHLLPASKLDEPAIAHLHTLSPSIWAPLIDFNLPLLPSQAPVTNEHGLICWLADINWPIAYPVSQLLLTLVNDCDKRDKYGDVLVRAVTRVLECVEEWDWLYWTIVHVVDGIEDRGWMRERFGASLKALQGRVPKEEEEDWGFGEVIGRCLGEGDGESEPR